MERCKVTFGKSRCMFWEGHGGFHIDPDMRIWGANEGEHPDRPKRRKTAAKGA